MKRLLREAMAGSADAQFNLGVLYGNGLDDNGHPISRKPREAIKWLLAAAKQGLPLAQMKLAEAYADSPNRSGGLAKAYFWFLLAGASLDGIHRDRAQAGGDGILGQLKTDEITAAVRLAQRWKPKPWLQVSPRSQNRRPCPATRPKRTKA